MTTNYKAGHFAETIALWFLRLKGYRFVAKNFVTGKGTNAGEIDLIVRRGKTLVFVEVKKRKTTQKALYAISPKQQMRLTKGAVSFIKSHGEYASFQLRFDAVIFSANRLPKHIPNAWGNTCGLVVF